MNGNSGIVPTVDLATNNGYAYPVMYGNGFGNSGFFGGDGIWALVLLALLFGNNGWGGFGGNGYNNIATTDYISSEFTQRDVNNGFMNLSTQVCNGFSDNATNICNLRSDVLTGNMGLQNSIMDSKYSSLVNAKDIERDVLMQTTQLENQASINALNASSQLANCCLKILGNHIRNGMQKIFGELLENLNLNITFA